MHYIDAFWEDALLSLVPTPKGYNYLCLGLSALQLVFNF